MRKKIILVGMMLTLTISLFGCSKENDSLETTNLFVASIEESIVESEVKEEAEGLTNVAQSSVESVSLVSAIDEVENEVVLNTNVEEEEIIPEEAYSSYYVYDKEEKILLNYLKDINMEIKKSSKEEIKVEITNNSEKEIIYGESYVLHQLKDDKWVEVSPIIDEVFFNAIGFVSNKDNPSTWNTKFENIYGKLEKGTYRIIKEYTFINNDYEKYYLSAEFNIK